MRLLFFIGSLVGGGAERVLVNLTSELAKRGNEITISLNDNLIAYDVNPLVKVIVAPKTECFKENGIIRRVVRRIKLEKHYYSFVNKTIEEIQPDIIISFLHCNMRSILRCHGNIPIILSEHNAFDRKLGLEHYYARFIKGRAFDKICLLTPFDQGYACAKGLKNTIVMPNPNTFDSITKEEYDAAFNVRRNIMACGRLDVWRVKGFDLVIMAFSIIANEFPDVDLDIVGEGSLASQRQLECLAEESGIRDRIHFLGRRNDIRELMRNHQLFVLSSRTEGFPMVLTEAMSQGVTCVSYERLASSIINDTIDGFLVSNGNVKEMAETIGNLLSNSSLRYRMGLEAANNVKRFSAENIAKRWEKMFFQLK